MQTRSLIVLTKIIQAIANGSGHVNTQLSNLQTIPAVVNEFLKKQSIVMKEYMSKLMVRRLAIHSFFC